MLRRLLPALVVTVAAWSPAYASLLDSWLEVQAHLGEGDATAAEEAITTLREEAVELEVRRMTGFAAALVEWAEANPGEDGEAMLSVAEQLDPDYPSSYFLAARWDWQQGATVDAVKETLAGWVALVKFAPTRRAVAAMLIMWTLFSIVAAVVAIIVVLVLRHLRSIVFDARELGGKIFRPANAWVFAFVLLLLPVFAALGPVWLGIYLFALSWPYLSQVLRIWAVVACLLLALTLPTLAWVQSGVLSSEPLAARVGTMLDDRQSDFATLREFSELSADLDEYAEYHLLLGELLRMHDEPALAKVEFEKATLLAPDNSQPLVFVANLALEEGNTKASIQYYNQALELNPNNAFAYHNLSLAFDLSRRFQEGDAARAKAREIAGREVAEDGLRGLDPRIRYPRLGSEDVVRFVESLSPEKAVFAQRSLLPTDLLRRLGSPLSLIFLVGAFLGLVALLIRLRVFPPARECTKCGKVYRLESGFGESTVYCSQCVSVFMKRDVVSIEQQTAKMAQIRRWERWTNLVRRVTGFLVPGSHAVVEGRVIRGSLTTILAMFFLTGALVWLPLMVPRIEPLASTRLAQIALLVLVGLTSLRSGIAAWSRR